MRTKLNHKGVAGYAPTLAAIFAIAIIFTPAAYAQTNIKDKFTDPNFIDALCYNGIGCDDDPIFKEDVEEITWLEISGYGIESLDGIEYFTALETLYADDNQLISVNLSKNTMLGYLNLSYNQLASVDLSKNTMLGRLDISSNQLISIDLSENTELYYLNLDNNQLTSLDMSSNILLSELHASNNHLTSIDVSKNIELAYLELNLNHLTSIDVSQNTELYKLALWSNQLTSIDLSKNTELSELDLDRNRLESLDITGLDYLWLFYYNYNYLSSITGCPEDECDFDYQLEAGFVAAAGITGVPRFAVVGVPLTLAGTVFPSDATNKTISQWYTYGDAVIDGNELTAEYSGTVNICAVIENGLAADEDYEPCFNIYVLDNGYEVAITQPSNGTISVKNGASTVADGDIIGRGTVLTLSVTPNSDYSFTSWWDDNTNPTRTFMVAKDVEISALFENTPIRLPQIASASNISVRAMGNNIVLQNLPAGAKVEVFSLNGKLISGKSFNQANQGSDMSISVQTKGMYIVKVSTGSATQTLRVSVR